VVVTLAALVALTQCLSCVSKPPAGEDAAGRPAAESKASVPAVSDPAFTDYWLDQASASHARAPAAVARGAVPLPDDSAVAAALRVDPEALVPERPFPTQAITLVMREAPVREVLQAFARSADINLLVGPKVTGTVSIELRDSAWDEAFAGLLKNLALHHCWSGDILRVITVEEMGEELKVEKAQKDKLALEHERQQAEPLIVDTIALHYADAAKLEPVIEAVLTKSDTTYTAVGERPRVLPRGEVVADLQSNTIVVSAVRADVAKVRRLVEVLDRPRHQVLVEAQIVLANRETARELGVQWGALYAKGRSFVYPGANSSGVLGSTVNTPIAPTSGFTSNPSGASGGTNTTGAAADGAAGGTTTGPAGALNPGLQFGYAYQKVGSLLLMAQLSALESAGKAHVVATPSITTIEDQEAILQSGYEIPYQSYSETEGNEVQFKDVLLELKVRPHVIAGGMVRLSITASNDEPDYSRVDTGVTDEPAITRRSAETNLVLYSGETTVIGGLSRSYGSDAREGIPWLMNLPWVGHLFRSQARTERHEEMLIFITPHILDETGASMLAPGSAAAPDPQSAPPAVPGKEPEP
jgi:type IV pilus assembly protein PilQ